MSEAPEAEHALGREGLALISGLRMYISSDSNAVGGGLRSVEVALGDVGVWGGLWGCYPHARPSSSSSVSVPQEFSVPTA